MLLFETSEKTILLDEALSSFQSEMKPIKKEAEVKMKGVAKKSGKEYEVNYDYAPLEDLQEKARPVLAKYKINVTQALGCIVLDSKIVSGIITRVAVSGEWLRSFWPLDLSGVEKEQDRGVKITFNKRYAYAAALNLILVDEDTDAVGIAANRPFKTQEPRKTSVQAPIVIDARGQDPAPVKHPNDNQIKRLYTMASAASWTNAEVKEYLTKVYKVGSTKELHIEQYDKFTKMLEKKTTYDQAKNW